MAIVIDCSIAMAWCFADEASKEADAILDRVRDEGAAVPALWHWEVANVLTGAVRKRRIAESDALATFAQFSRLPIAVDQDSPHRAWRETVMLSLAHKLTAYDAAYLELAMRLGCNLATLDTDLREAAEQVGVVVVP